MIVAGDGDPDAYDRSLEPRVRLWPAADFDWVHELRDFDRFLYVVGNSALHRHAMEALVKRPGVVVAHDVRFGALYDSLKPDWRENPVWTREKLHEMYGGRIPAADLRRATEDRGLQEQFGLYMSQEVQSHAEKLLVHSRYAADVLRMDRTPGTPAAETLVVGRGIPEEALRRNGGAAHGGATVLSHGAGERPEAIDLLMHAFASVAAERPEASLVLLGRFEEGAETRLAETASNLGLSESVHLVPHGEGDEYWRALAEADVAVELRTRTDGEASASVCDCLAARVPDHRLVGRLAGRAAGARGPACAARACARGAGSARSGGSSTTRRSGTGSGPLRTLTRPPTPTRRSPSATPRYSGSDREP